MAAIQCIWMEAMMVTNISVVLLMPGMFLQPPSSATAKQTNKQLPVNMISVLFVSTNILF